MKLIIIWIKEAILIFRIKILNKIVLIIKYLIGFTILIPIAILNEVSHYIFKAINWIYRIPMGFIFDCLDNLEILEEKHHTHNKLQSAYDYRWWGVKHVDLRGKYLIYYNTNCGRPITYEKFKNIDLAQNAYKNIMLKLNDIHTQAMVNSLLADEE